MSGPPELELITGAGDLIATLQELIDKARAGELEAVLVATVEGAAGTELRHYVAWRDDMAHAWSRVLASVESARYALLAEGMSAD